MLYDFIDLGIQHKKSWVVFGRTALEIKSSVGALPLTTLTLLRHSKPMTNVLVRWLTSIFRPEEVALRSVWKQESLNILTEKLGER
jgi:hypothetical protein